MAIKSKIEKGISEREYASQHFVTWSRAHRALARYKELVRPRRRKWKTEVHVIWGPTGTGKSSAAYMINEDVHDMHYCNQFWSKYDEEEEILIDDFDDRMITRNAFLKLTDRYPFKLRVLGEWKEFLAKKIYITSNYDPITWYGGDDAIMRRITSIKKLENN